MLGAGVAFGLPQRLHRLSFFAGITGSLMKTHSPRKDTTVFKTIIAAIIALLTGAFVTTLKKDKVILELVRDNTRLSSWDHTSSIFQDGYDAGYNRGWLDRNMNPEYPQD
jgi:hypothetical protein